MPAPTDRLAGLLSGPSRWHTLEHLDEVGSTNDVAADRTRAGTPPGLVIVADRQTAGRGRLGRRWEGAGVGASLLVSVTAALPEGPSATLVPLATGIAVVDAIRRQGCRAALKWPNDVLLGEAKCAGILVERHEVGGAGSTIVVGIGLNLDWRGVERPADALPWISIAEVTDRDVDRWDVLADLLRGLGAWLDDLARDHVRLLLQYRELCATIGLVVQVDFPDGEVLEGVAEDLDRDGRLIVRTDAGAVAVNAGDVHHLRPA